MHAHQHVARVHHPRERWQVRVPRRLAHHHLDRSGGSGATSKATATSIATGTAEQKRREWGGPGWHREAVGSRELEARRQELNSSPSRRWRAGGGDVVVRGLWDDAKARARAEAGLWSYSFLESPDFAKAH